MDTILFLLVVLLFVVLTSVGINAKAQGDKAPPLAKTAQTQVQAGGEQPQSPNLNRQNLERRLKELSTQKPPTDLNDRGAMCYKPKMAPTRADYVCPKCGSRTLYQNDPALVSFIESSISAVRRLSQEIKGIELRVDESEFCKKCSKGKKSSPKLIMIVNYAGRKQPHRVRGVSAMDLNLLLEFLSGKDVHKGPRDEETPLRDYLPRLEELLGIKIKAADEPQK